MTKEREQAPGAGRMLFGAAAVVLTLLLLIVGLGTYFWASLTGDDSDPGGEPTQTRQDEPEEVSPPRAMDSSGRRLRRSEARQLRFELEGLKTNLVQARSALEGARDDLSRSSWKQRIAELEGEIRRIEQRLRDGR